MTPHSPFSLHTSTKYEALWSAKKRHRSTKCEPWRPCEIIYTILLRTKPYMKAFSVSSPPYSLVNHEALEALQLILKAQLCNTWSTVRMSLLCFADTAHQHSKLWKPREEAKPAQLYNTWNTVKLAKKPPVFLRKTKAQLYTTRGFPNPSKKPRVCLREWVQLYDTRSPVQKPLETSLLITNKHTHSTWSPSLPRSPSIMTLVLYLLGNWDRQKGYSYENSGPLRVLSLSCQLSYSLLFRYFWWFCGFLTFPGRSGESILSFEVCVVYSIVSRGSRVCVWGIWKISGLNFAWSSPKHLDK